MEQKLLASFNRGDATDRSLSIYIRTTMNPPRRLAILALFAALAFACTASDVTDLRQPWNAVKLVSFNRGDASDRSWLAQTPTVSAGVTFPSTYRVADFDGTTSAIITYPNDGNLGVAPLTVSLWLRIDSPTNQRCNIIGKHSITATGAAAHGWYIHWSPSFGHGVACVENGVTNYRARISSRTSDNDGTWRHLAVTIDTITVSSGWVFYINGAPVTFTASDGASAPTTISTTETLMFGGLNWQSGTMTRLNGAIDDVRIYSTALTADQIGQIYAEGIGESRP